MRSLFRSLVALAAVSAIGLSPAALQAQTTVGSPTQTGLAEILVQNNGSGSSQVQWGQTFRTPNAASTSLSSWTVWATNFYAAYYSAVFPGSAATLPFVLAIHEWGGAAPVGPALFTSAPAIPTTDSYAADALTFSVGQVLDPTKIYVALVTATGINVPSGPLYISAIKYSCNQACGNSDPYTDGGLVGIWSKYDANGNLASQSINYYEHAHDMAFEATFNAPVTATPEPASMTLVATGMAGLAGYVRRRRKTT